MSIAQVETDLADGGRPQRGSCAKPEEQVRLEAQREHVMKREGGGEVVEASDALIAQPEAQLVVTLGQRLSAGSLARRRLLGLRPAFTGGADLAAAARRIARADAPAIGGADKPAPTSRKARPSAFGLSPRRADDDHDQDEEREEVSRHRRSIPRPVRQRRGSARASASRSASAVEVARAIRAEGLPRHPPHGVAGRRVG